MFKLLRKTNAAQSTPPAQPARPLSAQDQALQEKVNQYKWYHRIQVSEGVYTQPINGGFPDIWEFIFKNIADVDFKGKRVLDIGCRDGLFSFEAERRGAAQVNAFDNDLSEGARDFLIPHFGSKVAMSEFSLYELAPEVHGLHDVIMFFGVLYHLRYPAWGLRKIVDCLAPGGRLLLESGMLKDTKHTAELELLYCPVETSPYEETSCTFYNRKGLETTMRSFGLKLLRHDILAGSECISRDGKAFAERQFFVFEKAGQKPGFEGVMEYWDGTHQYHTVHAQNTK